MNFIVLSAVCVAVVVAQYDSRPVPDYPSGPKPAPGPYPGPSYPGPSYPGPSYPRPYPDYDDHDYNGGYRKLRDLKTAAPHTVVEADIRYFRRNGEFFAGISCPKSASQPSLYNWLLADAHRTTPSFAPSGTVALAAGINFEYVAKYSEHGRWEGRDFALDDKHRFRRVGCVVSSNLNSTIVATN
uniref:Uncharacterized protein n=1 Tax=Caenorhabditis japonica TaxID=281687 RepID=A0A8R1E4M6_CAEJA